MAEAVFSIDEEHEKNRHKVCLICYGKGKVALYDTEITVIREHIISDYSINNPDFPAAICLRCRMLIYRKSKNEDVNFPIVEDYNPNRPKNLRSLSSCNCKICTVAKAKLAEAMKMKPKRGRPCKDEQDKEVPEAPRYFKVCANCFTKIYPGCKHSMEDCHSRRSKVYNIQSLLDSPVTTERVTSRLAVAGTKLSTLGPRKKLIPAEPHAKQPQTISTEGIANIQLQMGLSVRRTHQLARGLRKEMDMRKVVEPGLKLTLHERQHQLDKFFEICRLEFQEGEEWAVVCNNVEQLIDDILRHRNITRESALIKIGADGGRGFFKICLSVAERQLRHVHNTFSNSGVKRLIILGIAPHVNENYFNLHKLWTRMKLKDLQTKFKFTIASDLKIINIITGIMSSSSAHPCSWCDVDKENLKIKRGNDRTLKNIQECYEQFVSKGSERKNAKKYAMSFTLLSYPKHDDTTSLNLLKVST